MKKLITATLSSLISLSSHAGSSIVWTAVFSDITPRNDDVSLQYCLTHTPTVMVPTVGQVSSKEGVETLNGLRGKYQSYKSTKKTAYYLTEYTPSSMEKTTKVPGLAHDHVSADIE